MAPSRLNKRKQPATEPPPSSADHKTPNNPRPVKMPKGVPKQKCLALTPSTQESLPPRPNLPIVSPPQAPQTTTTSSSPLEMLSDDILGNVFFSGYVNSIDIITSVSNVNKTFRRVCYNSVKMLDLRALPKLEAWHVVSLVERHGCLSSLEFGYCSQFGRDHLMALVPVAATLRTLCLRGTSVEGRDVVDFLQAATERLGKKPTGLEELDLSAVKREETSRIGDVAVSKIVQCCPQLKSLQLGWCKGVTNKCLPDLVKLRRLKELDLSLTSITEDGCSDLSRILELQKLDLSATNTGNDGIQDLCAPKRLERLHLEELKLSFNAQMTQEGLSLLATHMPCLKALDIRYCEIEKNDCKEIFKMLESNGTEVVGGG